VLGDLQHRYSVRRAQESQEAARTSRAFFGTERGDIRYTLWLFNIAMENGPFIDGLPLIFHGYVK